MSAVLRKNHYELVLKNNIPPYDWRKVYLQEYSTEMQESYGYSKEVVKQREEIK